MSESTVAERAGTRVLPLPSTQISWGKMGMWTFLASDATTFGALLVSAGILRSRNPDWPRSADVFNIPIAAIMTCLLLISSLWIVLALSAVKKGNQARFKTFLLLTITAGAFFLALQAFEWDHLIHQGMTLNSNPWGSGLLGATFYVLTGFHGAHVLGGIVYLICVLVVSRHGRYHAKNYDGVEIASLYWHFVDVVWILVFTFVYLL